MSAQPANKLGPLDTRQAALLEELTRDLDDQALVWLSGYAAGLAARAVATDAPASVEAAGVEPAPRLTVLYGSQTGNARRTAEGFAREAEGAGLDVRLVATGEYPVRELKKERYLLVVISTQGDGEPPDDALTFMEALNGKKVPRLDRLQYGVLALGDSSYPEFCAAGRQVDERLAELGATRLVQRGDCDLDIDTVAVPWWRETLQHARDALRSDSEDRRSATVTPLRPATRDRYDREHPFHAEILASQCLTTDDTDKDIRHIELDVEAAGLAFAPGDSLGVWHRNPPALVDAVLAALHLDGDSAVEHEGVNLPLAQFLSEQREITRLYRPFLERHASRCDDAALSGLLAADRRRECADFLKHHQLIDLLRRWPASWDVQTLAAALPPLTPRLYSIASSPDAIEDEVHLTVARVAYRLDGFEHLGAASNHLAGLDGDDRLAVYVEPNPRFRLPTDPDRDIVMVGPGTGVAPFRAFLQERVATGARGRNWLFFGARHFHSQFLYQLEWQRALKEGSLHRMELAFSRDQRDKSYVQHRLRECGREVFAWLEGGAHFYVCGGIDMEKDVKRALVDVVAEYGGRGAEHAEGYVKALQAEGRYCRDVY